MMGWRMFIVLTMLMLGSMVQAQLSVAENKYFTIYYPPRYVNTADLLSAEVDRFARQFCGELGIERPDKPIPVILDPHSTKGEIYPSPRWVNGFYRLSDKTIVLKTIARMNRQQESELITVFRHEAVHALLDVKKRNLPRWMEEGLAQSFSRGFTFWDGRLLLQVPRDERIPLLEDSAFQKEETARFAYPLAAGAMAYLRELGTENLRLLVDACQTMPFQQAFTSVYGSNLTLFMLMFEESFLSRYTLFSLLVSDEGMLTLLSILALILLVARRIRIQRKLNRLDDGIPTLESAPLQLGGFDEQTGTEDQGQSFQSDNKSI